MPKQEDAGDDQTPKGVPDEARALQRVPIPTPPVQEPVRLPLSINSFAKWAVTAGIAKVNPPIRPIAHEFGHLPFYQYPNRVLVQQQANRERDAAKLAILDQEDEAALFKRFMDAFEEDPDFATNHPAFKELRENHHDALFEALREAWDYARRELERGAAI